MYTATLKSIVDKFESYWYLSNEAKSKTKSLQCQGFIQHMKFLIVIFALHCGLNIITQSNVYGTFEYSAFWAYSGNAELFRKIQNFSGIHRFFRAKVGLPPKNWSSRTPMYQGDCQNETIPEGEI